MKRGDSALMQYAREIVRAVCPRYVVLFDFLETSDILPRHRF